MNVPVPTRVQRVIFPTDDVGEVLPLYLDGPGTALGRQSCRVAPGGHVSLCTYFNAFPAAYWRRWSTITAVSADVHLDTAAAVSIWRSDGRGRATLVDTQQSKTASFTVPVDAGFDDGGFYWLEVEAPADHAVILQAAQWSVDADDAPGTVSIGITTFNRPKYCLDQLRRISEEPDALSLIDRIYVVDQGSEVVRDQSGFSEVESALQGRLEVITQANLGGSGGFSRAMLETLEAGISTYVLLLDDDAISEPEAIIRATRFADLAAARHGVLVGGGMLRLDRRNVLFVQGETIDLAQGRPSILPGLSYNHDFEAQTLAASPALHLRRDALYNAWWMCLIPVEVIRRIGLGLPYFIKWDDMEFGLRAAQAGYPTVSLPGVAVWHQAWDDKYSWRSWEEYFSERNMLLTMTAHQSRPRRVPLRAFSVDVGMILSLQYSSAALRIAARRDATRGFAPLHEELRDRLQAVRSLRARFSDADKQPTRSAFPPVSGPPVNVGADQLQLEIGSLRDAFRAAMVGLKHLAVPPRRSAREAPQVELDGHEAIWRQFLQLDSALVRYPDGYVWVRRDWATTWRLLGGSLRSAASLWLSWQRLHHRAAAELPSAFAAQRWRRTFGM